MRGHIPQIDKGCASIETVRPAISARIFVGNLNFETTEFELREHLEQAGEIVDFYLATDRVTGRSRGFAFATYATENQAFDAIERFNQHDFGGRRLNVNEAEERPRRDRPMGGGGGRGGGLPFNNDNGFGGSKKPFKNKGSRRGLRARKRSL